MASIPFAGIRHRDFPLPGLPPRTVVAPGPIAEALDQQPEEGLCFVVFPALVETGRASLVPFCTAPSPHRAPHRAPRRSPSPNAQSGNLLLKAWEAQTVRLIELSVPE